MSERPFLSPPFPAPDGLISQRLKSQHTSTQCDPDQVSLLSGEKNSDTLLDHVPGEPNISLAPSAVFAYLEDELATPLLDELYCGLWLVGRNSGRSIDSLNTQRIKGREIIATEAARLHLVWHSNKIYVKPIPPCLLNYDFWARYLSSTSSISSITDASGFELAPVSPSFDRSVALGFIRSYAFLVRYRLDYVLARDLHLIPAEVSWERWSKFAIHFRNINDHEVARRYHYGQLRLSRLNWAVRLFRPQSASSVWFYEIPHWSIRTYVERALAPLLFGFGSLSLVLSSMQVALSVPGDGLGLRVYSPTKDIRPIFWGFSILVLLFSAVVWTMLCFIPFSALLWQLLWGFRNRNKGRVTISALA